MKPIPRKYLGSVVLGLTDAIVELTGTLAGLSFALQNTKIIALAGLITGISASLSMASSEYLSKRSENDRAPLTAAAFTGFTYVLTVAILVLPFFIAETWSAALIGTLALAAIVILIFSYITAHEEHRPFKKNFSEMIIISFTVAAISFGIGLLLRNLLGINV